MKTLFRADSSAKIGLGHIKRDLVYAQRLATDQISFACIENTLALPYPVHTLVDNSIQTLIDLCQKEQIEHLIIDHYGIGYEEEKALKEALNIKVSVFDDTYERHYCDEIINHNISADASRYTLVPFCTLSIIPPLIRDEFKQIAKRNRQVKTNEIMIAMGGVDSLNLTPAIIPLCEGFHKIHVITSSLNANLDTLKALPLIELHIDTDEMATIMNQCDLAIITPSVIVHEALYMRLPFIAIQTAKNQQDLCDYLNKKHFSLLSAFDEDELTKLISHEQHFPHLDFAIRKTLKSDLLDFFNLANEPSVRQASLNTRPIELSTHTQWFEKALSDPNRLLFTILDARANFLGQLRFDLLPNDEALVSFSLVSGSRGLGLATPILRQGLKIMQKLHPTRTILAQIRVENLPSQKSFDKAGFIFSHEKDDILHYYYKAEQ